MRRSMVIALTASMAAIVPAFAQTKAADQKMRQQVEATVTQYVDALNKGDAQAYATLFAGNAIDITPFGKYKKTGEEFRENIDRVHGLGLALKAEVDDVEAIFGGQGAVATAPYSATFAGNPNALPVRGNLLFVLEHVGDGWKIRVQTAARLAPAPATK